MKPRHQVSRAAVDLIKRFEGYRQKAAQLPDGRWTVGYGHTLTAREGASVSEKDAEALLLYDLISVAHSVNEKTYAPRYTFDFTARYAYPLSSGELFAFTDWKVQGYTNLFLYESKEFYTDGDFEGGLKVGYANKAGGWEVAAFARNITNENNIKGAIDFNNLTAFVNEPRVIGVSLDAKF